MISNGFEGLRVIGKKFLKQINDLAFTYYREKKLNTIKKSKRLLKEQIENVRYNFKHGIYS